jgi:hypothetical protein
VADAGEDDVGGVAGAAFEIAAAEVTFGLQVADDGLDGGAAPQLGPDDTEDAALLARDEDAAGILRVVAPVPLRNCKVWGPQAPNPCNLKCPCIRKTDSRSIA